MDRHFLNPLFDPRSIVVFAGAIESRDAMTPYGRAIVEQLKSSYAGPVTLLDVAMTGRLADLADARADLAIVALAPADCAPALEIAGRIKCRSALVLGTGATGTQTEEFVRIAQYHGMYLLGPNCVGFQRPSIQLNASLAGPLAADGALGLVAQSGALTTAILDWGAKNAVGFSAAISVGRSAAVDLAQALDFLAHDVHTHSVVVYMEGIADARRFMSALRAAANAKPVIVLKAGHVRRGRGAGAQAALTHAAAIVGSDEVFDAALRRAGAVRVRSFTQLFAATKCLASRYRPVHSSLAVITNGGGPGVLAADWIDEIGLELGRLSDDAIRELQPKVNVGASLRETIDLGEDATPEQYASAIRIAATDRSIGGVLAIFTPKQGRDPVAVAQAVVEASHGLHKPVLASWMGDDRVAPGRAVLNAASIPSFRTPEGGVDAFGNIAAFYLNQQLLQQTPTPLTDLQPPDLEGARLIVDAALAERRYVLSELESKALLSAFHVPVTQTVLARSANEAMLIANQLGYPVALKIDSPDIAHKSDVQGVVLNLPNAASVRDAYVAMIARIKHDAPSAHVNGATLQRMAGKAHGRELCIGLVTDEPFGPVITFGAGGTMIELIADRAMELPPLNRFLARRLIERSRAAETLGPWRGAPAADVEALERVLLRVSEMVCELPQLREMDINPIVVDAHGAIAVDACIVIGEASTRGYEHLAILPYPAGWHEEWPLRDGHRVVVRPIHPDDADLVQTFVRGLSAQSRYFRFASSLKELSARMLARYTLIDYDREMALIALAHEPNADDASAEHDRMVGVSRYVMNPDATSCEFSLVVSDDMTAQGIGSRLMRSIMAFARDKGLAEMHGLVLQNNDVMLRLMKSLGFEIKAFPEDPDFRLVSKTLN